MTSSLRRCRLCRLCSGDRVRKSRRTPALEDRGAVEGCSGSAEGHGVGKVVDVEDLSVRVAEGCLRGSPAELEKVEVEVEELQVELVVQRE